MRFFNVFTLAGCALFITASFAEAQETSVGYRVWISAKNERLMLRGDTTCAPTVGGVRNETCPASGTTTAPRKLRQGEEFGGWANIYKDATETGFLNVNFWPRKCKAADQACLAQADSIRSRQYVIKFKNRESEVFPSQAWHVKVMTMPLKYRTGYTRGSAEVESRTEAGISGNVLIGYRFGWEKYYYERGAARDPYTVVSVTPGIFIGASAVTVGEATSKAASTPRTKDVPMGVFSGGLGVTLGWRTLSVGAFRGWDAGLGDVAKQWDFNQRPYWGLGITLDTFLGSGKL